MRPAGALKLKQNMNPLTTTKKYLKTREPIRSSAITSGVLDIKANDCNALNKKPRLVYISTERFEKMLIPSL